MARRKRVVTLIEMQGAETWVRVEHAIGWFAVPGCTTVLEVLEGACLGWRHRAHRKVQGEAHVTLPLSELQRLWSIEERVAQNPGVIEAHRQTPR